VAKLGGGSVSTFLVVSTSLVEGYLEAGTAERLLEFGIAASQASREMAGDTRKDSKNSNM
jgi:hypothetical protein